MNPEFTSTSFPRKSVPTWTCPTCGHGQLRPVSDLTVEANAGTQNNQDEEWWDYEYAGYIFMGLLKCAACNEHVTVSGTGDVCQDYTEDGTSWEYTLFLTPTYFNPPLKVINPKTGDNVPFEITQLLHKAHEVCWADPDSALNRLRAIVEEILDFKGVSRTRTDGRYLSLHRRIEMFTDPNFEQVKKALLAVKYVGNDGSHGFSGASRKELLEIFSIVNFCLEKVFPRPADDSLIIEAINRINSNEGLKPRVA